MNSKRGLMTVLVGVAMLAMPLTAAAKDHGRFQNSQARSFASAPSVAPVYAPRHESRNGATWMPAPAGLHRYDWREHREWENSNYGRGYYGAPAYGAPAHVAPMYAAPYGGGYGGGNGCGAAQHVMRTDQRDRATGHPAAAADVLRQNQWALRSGCAGGAPYGGGLFGGLGGYRGHGAAPVYNNYGGYNGGYGQPYGNGSMLAPLLQYIR